MVLTTHAKERVKQRFGIDASNAMYRRWVLENKYKIKKGKKGDSYTLLIKIEDKLLLFVLNNELDAITVMNPLDSYKIWSEKVNCANCKARSDI